MFLVDRCVCTDAMNACNSVDDIVFVGLIVVQIAGEELGTNVPSRVRYPERSLPALLNRYHSLHPYEFNGSFGRMIMPTQSRVGLSNRLRSYTFRFRGSPAVRLTDLQFSRYYFSCLYVCLCGTTLSAGTHLALSPIALRGRRPSSSSYAYSPKGGALRPFGSLFCST